MAPPSTFKMGPLTNCTCPARRYQVAVFAEMLIGALPSLLLAILYLGVALGWNPWQCPFTGALIDLVGMINPLGTILVWMLFPLVVLAGYYLYLLGALLVAKIILFVETRLHPPREGVFDRTLDDPDYFHWNARRYLKKFPAWLSQLVPFPWLRGPFLFRALGARVGECSGLMEAWIDLEMVTIEDGVALGRASVVSSHYLTPDYLILYPVHVGRDAMIGERARVTPGTVVGAGAIITARSVTRMDERIPPGHVFHGNPAADQGERPRL